MGIRVNRARAQPGRSRLKGVTRIRGEMGGGWDWGYSPIRLCLGGSNLSKTSPAMHRRPLPLWKGLLRIGREIEKRKDTEINQTADRKRAQTNPNAGPKRPETSHKSTPKSSPNVLFWGSGGVLEGSRAILGGSWGILGVFGGVLGTSWAVLGAPWAVLGPSWGRPGAILASPSSTRHPRHIKKPMTNT